MGHIDAKKPKLLLKNAHETYVETIPSVNAGETAIDTSLSLYL